MKTMITSCIFRLVYLAIAAVLTFLYFLPTFCVNAFGENMLSFSFFDLTRGIDLLGFSGEGVGFFAVFLILPAVEMLLAIPTVRPGLFITPVTWVLHIILFVGSVDNYISVTGLGRCYLLLILAQAGVFLLYLVSAIREAAVRRKARAGKPRGEMKRYCPHCHTLVSIDAKFCTSCGKAMPQEETGSPVGS